MMYADHNLVHKTKNMKKLAVNFTIALIGIVIWNSLRSEVVTVATATNFLPTIRVLEQDFESKTKLDVEIRSASSGVLFAQISRGMQIDIFLSADEERVDQLIRLGFGKEKSSFVYAIGGLALWFPTTKPVLTKLNIEQAKSGLAKSKRIGIANEKVAPYGLAAINTMSALNLPNKDTKIIRAENIGQTFALASSGNVDAAFIAMSQIKNGLTNGSYWEVDSTLHPPINQKVILLSKGEENSGARLFFQFLRSESAQRRIRDAGYKTPENSIALEKLALSSQQKLL